MPKCKCKTKARIVSNQVRNLAENCCKDVCTNPICGEPDMLSIMAPLIYDEIGINLCTTFATGVDISTTYPNATNATIRVINATFTNGEGGVTIEPIPGRPNCYLVTLTNITVTFALNLYDDSCRLIATIYPTAVYLPSETTADTYDEDTNPTSVELEIFAPYGISYNTAGTTPEAVLNYIGFSTTNNFVTQGINMYGLAKLLDFNRDEDTVTVGLTFVVQSLYFAGYKVKSCGKIDTPKGSIMAADNSDCMRFVAGALLDLAIKPLDLGAPYNEQYLKKECFNPNVDTCGACKCNSSGEGN